jgi:N-acetylmuramoyl-L-alanine amidase
MIEAAVFCLAMNIYHEARGESSEGRRFVAYVTMNRAMWDERLVCQTVFQSNQFSWANGKVQRVSKWHYRLDMSLKPRDHAAWEAAQALARTIILIGNPGNAAGGAIYYHATCVRPRWAKAFTQVAHVGNHIFYR